MNLRLLKEIDADTFSRKATELRDREGRLKVRRSRSRRATSGVTNRPNLRSKRFDYRKALSINCTIVDVSLAPEWSKPFDLLIEGLTLGKSRAGGI